MTNSANESKNQVLIQRERINPKEVVAVIYLLEIITKVGKHFPILFLSLACLNVLMAANDFLSNSMEFGIMNSIFAASGFFSLIHFHQRNKIYLNSANNEEPKTRAFYNLREEKK